MPHGEVLVVGRGVSGEIMAKSVVLNGDSSVSEDDGDLNCQTSEVHLYDDMSILILFLLCMEAIKMIMTFLFNSCSIKLHFFKCNPCCLSPLLCYLAWEGGPLLSVDRKYP
jgi:hypothetical protein